MGNSAWGKWYFCTFTVGKMSLDDQIKALQEELAKARAWKEKVEAEVEAIADRMAQAMIAGASASQIALLKRVLTKFCNLMKLIPPEQRQQMMNGGPPQGGNDGPMTTTIQYGPGRTSTRGSTGFGGRGGGPDTASIASSIDS